MAFASHTQLLPLPSVKRGLYFVVGAQSMVVGNYLPKLRPLVGDRLRAAAAERAVGWMLVLTGISEMTLYAFAPLGAAVLLSCVLGFSAILALAASRVDLVSLRGQPAAPCGQRRIMAGLLGAFIAIFLNTCASLLADGRSQAFASQKSLTASGPVTPPRSPHHNYPLRRWLVADPVVHPHNKLFAGFLHGHSDAISRIGYGHFRQMFT